MKEPNIKLELKQVERKFSTADGVVAAVDGVDLQICQGSFNVIRGASGCGKTTLLLMAGALMQPSGGTVEFAGTDPYLLSKDRRSGFRAENIGFVFQQFNLIPYLSVIENVMAATLSLPDGVGKEEYARTLLAKLNMETRLNHLPSKLSTGEQQRTALARAMINRPKLILADEPTGNLDPENGDIVLQTLKDFTQSGGMVLMVTHDRRAEDFADVVHKMEKGKFI